MSMERQYAIMKIAVRTMISWAIQNATIHALFSIFTKEEK